MPNLPIADMTTEQLVTAILELTAKLHGLRTTTETLNYISKQTGFAPRSLQYWYSGAKEPQPRNRLTLEYMLQQLLQATHKRGNASQ
jgi:hypothetical protein